jgi:hypothetical protein
MKTIIASAFAVAALLSTGASASEARHNGMLVGKAAVEQSTLGGFQALGQATFAGNTGAVNQITTDPARDAMSGK